MRRGTPRSSNSSLKPVKTSLGVVAAAEVGEGGPTGEVGVEEGGAGEEVEAEADKADMARDV